MKIVSFATDDPFWQVCKIIFETHHRAMGFDVEVTTIPRSKTIPSDKLWLDTCFLKPQFMLNQLQSTQVRPLIWMDVDCILHRFDGFDKPGVGVLKVPGGLAITCGFLAFGDGSEDFAKQWVSLVSSGRHDHSAICKIYKQSTFSPIWDITSSIQFGMNEIKGGLKFIRGTLPCPECGEMYWDAFRYCTVAVCNKCKKRIKPID